MATSCSGGSAENSHNIGKHTDRETKTKEFSDPFFDQKVATT